MENNLQNRADNPIRHTSRIRAMLTDLIHHLREDVSKINDPKAQALMETSAEVLAGLRKAYEDFEKKNEEAWKKAS